MVRCLAALTLALAVPTVSAAQGAAGSRMLVVPFEMVRNEPHQHWLSEASAILLADGLRSRGVPAITRAERVTAFEQLHLPLTASLSRATVIKVGQLVRANEVAIGTLRVEGDELTVRVHTIRLDAGRVQPEVTDRGPLTELLAIFDRVAQRLSRDAPLAPGPQRPAPPLVAFEDYVKGLLAESAPTRANFLEAAIKNHPQFDRARLALWEVRTDQADHEAALAAAKGVPAASPFVRRARFFSAISLLELRRYDESFEVLKGLLDSAAQGNAAVLNNLGIIQIRRGATAEGGTAAYHLTKAVDAQPDPDYLFNLGYAYVVERNYQGALYWLRESLRRDPTDADAHYVLAAALQATGSTVEATRERDIARQLSARYEALERTATDLTAVPSGLERLSMDLEGSLADRVDQGTVNSAQREQRELATFHLERGRRLYDREQDRDAMTELRRAVYLSPYEAEAHLLIGRIHLRAGRPTDAIEALKISIWSVDSAPARVTLAEAYLKAGDRTAARAAAERALALDPESAAAKRLLADIPR